MSAEIAGLKICVLTDDAVGDYMGAGGIRTLRFASALSRAGADVTIFAAAGRLLDEDLQAAALPSGAYVYEGFDVHPPEEFAARHADFGVALASTIARRSLPGIKRFGGKLVHDLVCPFMLENRTQFAAMPRLKRRAWEAELLGDFFEIASRAGAYLVASEVQSAFWAGVFTSEGLWDSDFPDPPPVFIAPSGVEAPQVFGEGELPAGVKAILKKLHSLGERKIIATSGGAYGWLSLEPLLHAVKRLAETGYPIALFLAGLEHPGGGVTDKTSEMANGLVQRLGIEDIVVTCGWLPHKYRFEALRRASLGVNLHPQSLETEMSYRNRLLDFASVEVPVATSIGGVVSSRMLEYGIALPVVNLDPSNVADVIKRALDATWGKNFRFACAGFRQEFDAEKCAEVALDAVRFAHENPVPEIRGKRTLSRGFAESAYFAARKAAKTLLGR